MTMTKKSKKRLCILIAAAVVIGAAVTAAVLLLRPQPQGPHLVQAYEEKDNPMFIVVDGLEREEFTAPLAFYGLELPEGWEQDVNAEQTANRFSFEYRDIYRNQITGLSVTLFQEPALNNRQITVEGDFQMIPFGKLKVVCYRAPVSEEARFSSSQSGAYWIYEDTLFTLTCQEDLEFDQIMELVGLVNYDTQREPIYSPLRFVCVPGTSQYSVEGNPRMPEEIRWNYFTETPEGYTPVSYTDNSNATSTGLFFFGISAHCIYENDRGDTLTLTNWTFANSLFNISSLEEVNDPEAVEEVTVGGREGLIHINDQVAEMAWLVSDDCYLTITCTAPLSGNLPTREQLLDLASTVSQDAPPPVVEE